jgi:uncharacterized protein (DUF58 family)
VKNRGATPGGSSGYNHPLPSTSHSVTGNVWRDLRQAAQEAARQVDRAAWRRFFLAIFGLTLSLFVALYATALRESGRYELAAVAAFISLAVAGLVAVKVVPFLARRTALERWMMKVEYEFTREGAVYLAIIGVITIAALNTGNNLLFLVLASLLAGILASGICSKIVLERLELELLLPDHLFARRPVVARLSLLNLKYFFPSFSVTISSRQPKRRKRQIEAQPPEPAILSQPVYVPFIPRRTGVGQRVELLFPRRGRYTQDGFRVSTKFPFGFLRKAHEITTRQEVTVLPDIQPTEEFYEVLPLLGSEIESYSKGSGHDLYAIRDYQESDAARHVDWKATAKAQQLKVREFTREDERRVVLVFDRRIPDAKPETLEKFEKAVNFCACLAWHFYEIDAQMQLVVDGFETALAPSADIIYPALERLALIEPEVSTAPRSRPPWAGAGLGFRIILTSQPRGTIPTEQWGSSYFIFMNSL